MSVTAVLAAVKRGFSKKPMSSMGWSVCSSHMMKHASAATPTANAPSTRVLVQPWSGPSMMPNSNDPSATMDSTAPSGSSRGAEGSFDSGTKKWPAISAVAAMGRFTQNTELHEKWVSSSPPITGPSATPSPEKPAQIAMARPRSFGSRNTLVRMDSVDGMMSAPPTPMSALVRMSCDGLPASADITDPMANTTMPTRNANLRPNRSPRLPAVSSRPAKTRV